MFAKLSDAADLMPAAFAAVAAKFVADIEAKGQTVSAGSYFTGGYSPADDFQLCVFSVESYGPKTYGAAKTCHTVSTCTLKFHQ